MEYWFSWETHKSSCAGLGGVWAWGQRQWHTVAPRVTEIVSDGATVTSAISRLRGSQVDCAEGTQLSVLALRPSGNRWIHMMLCTAMSVLPFLLRHVLIWGLYHSHCTEQKVKIAQDCRNGGDLQSSRYSGCGHFCDCAPNGWTFQTPVPHRQAHKPLV